jgi:hypothetical protein
MSSALLVLGLVVMPVLLVALYRRLGDLPLSVWAVAQRERARSEPRALDAMAEAVAAKSGQALIVIQAYQEQIAESLRAQIADAETRARVAERRAADAGTALSAAADLVRELHRSLEAARILTRELRELRTVSPKEPSPKEPSVRPAPLVSAADTESDDGERTTTEVPFNDGAASGPKPRAPSEPDAPPSSARGGAEEPGFDEDENTMIASRPATLPSAPRRRLIPMAGLAIPAQAGRR